LLSSKDERNLQTNLKVLKESCRKIYESMNQLHLDLNVNSFFYRLIKSHKLSKLW